MTTTATQIEITAKAKGMTVSTVIPNQYLEVEYFAVRLRFGVTAFFMMNNETFDYSYSHTYSAITDKTTKSKPKGF